MFALLYLCFGFLWAWSLDFKTDASTTLPLTPVCPRYLFKDLLVHYAIENEFQNRLKEESHQTSQLYLHHSSSYSKLSQKVPSNIGSGSSCAKFPSFQQLRLHSRLWQIQRIRRITLYLYGAYYDSRTAPNSGRNSVRILAVTRVQTPPLSWCQIWFQDEAQPTFAKVNYTNICYLPCGVVDPLRLKFQNQLLTCEIPETHQGKIPISVSVVESSCASATNNLKVIYDIPSKNQDIAVCVRSMDFAHDISARLIEWIEINLLLGARKIFFYEFYVHPNMKRVLKYYEDKGLVEVRPITLPGGQPNEPEARRRYFRDNFLQAAESGAVSHNDCFYRNFAKYKYIIPLDIDEVVMPLQSKNWTEMINQLEKNKRPTAAGIGEEVSFVIENVFFLEWMTPRLEMNINLEIPPHNYMLQQIYRQSKPTPTEWHKKTFQYSGALITVGSHVPETCITNGPCIKHYVSKKTAQLQHYRKDCRAGGRGAPDFATWPECDQGNLEAPPVRDIGLWRFKNELIARTSTVLKDLKFLSI